MNREQAPAWLPTYLVPFFTLSYPVDTPAKPDSFPNSNYYVNGPLDLCFIVMWIGALALIRDGLRLKVFEPFARQWHLRAERNAAARRAKRNATKSTPTSEKSISPEYKTIRQSKQDVIRERNVMRFGEQSYQWIYFVVYWSYGAVSTNSTHFDRMLIRRAVLALQLPALALASRVPLDRLSVLPLGGLRQVLLPLAARVLDPLRPRPQRRGAPKGPCANDDPPRRDDHAHHGQLLCQRHPHRLPHPLPHGLV